jgi:hypothetical protein
MEAKKVHGDSEREMWIVIVDDKYGIFDDKTAAERVFDLVGDGPEGDELADTPFGSASIVPFEPGWQPAGDSVDIEAYISRRWAQWRAPKSLWPKPGPVGDIFDELFGPELN